MPTHLGLNLLWIRPKLNRAGTNLHVAPFSIDQNTLCAYHDTNIMIAVSVLLIIAIHRSSRYAFKPRVVPRRSISA
jgi:hypothetical protein